MRTFFKSTAAAAIALAALAAPALRAGEAVSGEEELAKLLEGRVAGEAESCIRTWGHARMRIIDGTAIVYTLGGTMWVNRTQRPETLDDDDILVILKFDASSLCRQDMITTADRLGGFYTGNLVLSDFVPYRRTDS